MSVTIDWMDSRYTVIHANFIDHWDWGELQKALAKAHHLMTKSSHSVTLMLDFVGSIKATKTDSLTMLEAAPAPPNLVRLVIISDDPRLAQKMEDVLHQFYPHAEDIQSARSHEEAFSLVRQTLEIAAVKID